MTPVKTVTSSEKPENVGLPPTPGPEVDIDLTGPDVKPQKEEPARESSLALLYDTGSH